MDFLSAGLSGRYVKLSAGIEKLVPKSEAQILTEAAEELESGVPMYYAEQLE